MSFAETSVTRICGDVQIIARARIGVRDLPGDNLWKRSKLFLEAFGNFTEPGPDLWESILRVYKIRNLFVHNDDVPVEGDEKQVLALANSVPGFRQASGMGSR
jgi:hypothetical protein